eukprot:12911021-Prorocentrum_lima.AAC.1
MHRCLPSSAQGSMGLMVELLSHRPIVRGPILLPAPPCLTCSTKGVNEWMVSVGNETWCESCLEGFIHCIKR